MKRCVKDVMTRDVIVVDGSTSYKEIVVLMRANDVSALPVVSADGALIGIVSEADLLLKEEHGTTAKPRRIEVGRARAERERATGIVASQLMTSPVITLPPDASIAQAARLMNKERVKRAPVVNEHGKVIGIVSRKDLLKIFLRSDEDIREEIVKEVIEGKLWLAPHEGNIQVAVDDGLVTLSGWTDRKTLGDIAADLAAAVEGVVRVDNVMTYKLDDTRIRPEVRPAAGVLPYAVRR